MRRRVQPEDLPRIGRRRHHVTEDLDDLRRLLHQRRIAWRELALFEIDVVLEPDPRMAAEQHGLRHHRELIERYAEGEPWRARRQEASHIGHGLGGRGLRPGDAEANLEHAGRLDMAVLDHALGEQEMTGLEHLQFRQHAGVADRDRHGLEVRRRVDEDVRAHVHAAHVEAADVRFELDDVAHAFGWRLDGGARSRLLRVLVARHEARAGAGGEVDQHIAAASPDAVDHVPVEGRVHAGPGGLRVAHVDMDDGRAGVGSVDRRLRDLRGRHRNRGVAAGGVRRPGDRARDHDLALHLASLALFVPFWSQNSMRGRRAIPVRRPKQGARATVHRGVRSPRRRGLPPFVHCAKPWATRPWSESELCDKGDFVSACGSLAAGGGGLSGFGASEVRSPMNELLLDYLPLAIFIAVALGISLAILVVPFIVAYKQPDPEKLSAYECGFNAFDDARMKFDVRFYLVAILFIIFDLEMSFMFPWAIAFGDLGLYGYWSMMVFLGVLTIGFIYEWRKGALEWD